MNGFSRLPASVVFGLLALAALSGCGSVGPVQQDTFFLLPVGAPATNARLTDGAIRVRPFTSTGLYRDRAILYSDGSDFEIKRHHYYYWADSPAELLRAGLIAYLRAGGAADLVLESLEQSPDYDVSGRIVSFERHIGGGDMRVNVGIELRLDRRGEPAPVLIRDYTQSLPVRSDSVADAVATFGEAVNMIFARFLDDARQAIGRG